MALMNIRYIWLILTERRRLSLRNTRDNSEVWYTHISITNIVLAVIAIFILMFILTLTLVGYSSIMELLPGYRSEALRSRENITYNIMRLDSMERIIDEMMLYNQNVSLIMDGKTPVVRASNGGRVDSIASSKSLVAANRIDTLLRQEMEGDGRYSLKLSQAALKSPMTSPTDGIILKHFNIAEQRFGTTLSTKKEAQIMAVQDGIVVLSLWSVDGYTIEIMHADNMLSICKNLSETCVERAMNVKAGEVIGYSTGQNREITFELWVDGKPVDPAKYIIL